jgi:hypothetical protein
MAEVESMDALPFGEPGVVYVGVKFRDEQVRKLAADAELTAADDRLVLHGSDVKKSAGSWSQRLTLGDVQGVRFS